MTSDLQDIPQQPIPPKPPATLRAALAELSLSSAIVLAEIETSDLKESWKKKPNTARLLNALELAREALSQ